MGLRWLSTREDKAGDHPRRGILRLDGNVSADLADEAIEHIQVLGALRAPEAVLKRIEDRITRNLDGASWL